MARANVVNTLVVPSETQVSPYYDDFNESKNFHRIIFRGGEGVQARELTQIQTILQNQIERFGRHIFVNGSSVIGGDSSTTVVRTINLSSTYANTSITPANFKNKTIRYSDANNTVIARVLGFSNPTSTEPPAIHVKYQTGIEFQPSDTIKIDGEEVYANIVPTSNASSNGMMAYIYDSIYFYNGFFIKVPTQSIVLSKYTVAANARVGLELDDSIVTSDNDTSLLDPALEASAYQATGADRYKVELVLAKRDLDSTDDTNFIEISRIENGYFKSKVEFPIYSEIEEVFARRTFDESGSYTVREFKLRMDESTADSPNNVTAVLSPGKAYVYGYEYETISDSRVEVPRARTKANVSNYDLNLNYGNYVIVDGLKGLFDPTTQELIDIHSVPYGSINFANTTTYNTTKIGTARVRDLEFFSGDTDVDARKHELYIFSSTFTSGSFANANSFVKHTSYTTGASSNANTNITTLNKDNGLANGLSQITEPSLRKMVFPFPEKYISEGSILNPSYQFRKKFTGVQFTAGTSAAITAGIDEQFVGDSASSNVASTVTDNFLVIVTDKQGSARANGEQIKVTTSVSGGPEQVVFATAGGGADTFQAAVLAKMEVDGASAAARVKSLVKANTQTFASEAVSNTFVNTTGSTTGVYLTTGQITITNPSKTPGTRESLFVSDVIAIKKIYDLNGAAIPAGGADITSYTDVTNRYELDTGQRDTHYDHASIILKPGFAPPTGPLIVCARFFTSTTDVGYFSVDSYPSLSTVITEEGTDLGTGYAIIPTYTATDGEKLFLRDCIDFRPVRTNASNTNPNFTFTSVRIPVPVSDFQSDYSYYLGRRDLIVMTPNREIKRVAGTPAKFPQNPVKPSKSMVLYSLGVSPYTAYPSNVAVKYIDNRRYTMRDIGLIDKRLKNVEYYVSLNSLEKDALDITITDVDGLERTKYGILADNFNGHALSASDRFDYQAAMNYKQGWMQAKANNEAIKLEVDTATISDIEVHDEKITLDYTEEAMVFQNAATKFTAVAEFLFADFEGQIITIPESDIWKSVNAAPAIINTQFENNETFNTITVSNQQQAEDALNDVLGGDTQSRTRGRGR
jgi:hypothetical protein